MIEPFTRSRVTEAKALLPERSDGLTLVVIGAQVPALIVITTGSGNRISAAGHYNIVERMIRIRGFLAPMYIPTCK
jgi:hypothetical protein